MSIFFCFLFFEVLFCQLTTKNVCFIVWLKRSFLEIFIFLKINSLDLDENWMKKLIVLFTYACIFFNLENFLCCVIFLHGVVANYGAEQNHDQKIRMQKKTYIRAMYQFFAVTLCASHVVVLNEFASMHQHHIF